MQSQRNTTQKKKKRHQIWRHCIMKFKTEIRRKDIRKIRIPPESSYPELRLSPQLKNVSCLQAQNSKKTTWMPSLHLPQTQIYHRGLTNYLDGFTFLSPSLVIHNFVPNTSWTPYIHFSSIWARCSRSPSQKTMLQIRKNEGSVG